MISYPMSSKSQDTIKIGVGSANPVKINSVRSTFQDVLEYLGKSPIFDIEGYNVDSGVPDQPIGLETIYNGAYNRAREASTRRENDYSIGLEAGIYIVDGKHIDLQFCVIIDKKEWVTMGHSGGFTYPESVIEKVKTGMEVGDIFATMSGKSNIKSQEGAIGMLSRGFINRTGFSRQSVLMALIPRISPELYDKC